MKVLGFTVALAVCILGWSRGGEGWRGWRMPACYNLLSYYAFGQWLVFVGGISSFSWSGSQIQRQAGTPVNPFS